MEKIAFLGSSDSKNALFLEAISGSSGGGAIGGGALSLLGRLVCRGRLGGGSA